jgi:hypothetical protein
VGGETLDIYRPSEGAGREILDIYIVLSERVGGAILGILFFRKEWAGRSST